MGRKLNPRGRIGIVHQDVSRELGLAVRKGVTNDTSATTLSLSDTCTRDKNMTFLYRDMV